MRRSFVLLAVLSGCLQSGVHHCEDGSICAVDRACAPGGRCVFPEQLADCAGNPEQTPCTIPGGTEGACLSGVCLPVGCGNSVVEGGEVCDDGNTAAGDGCSAHCESTEQCGNALLDTISDEQCDCGDASVPDVDRPPGCNGPNSSAPGANCNNDCTLIGCGDGMVGGLEQCDGSDLPLTMCSQFGYYAGTLSCLSSCRFDTSNCTGRCGDDVRNGPSSGAMEVCDGSDLGGLDCRDLGFYSATDPTCNAACFYDTASCSGRCGDSVVNGPETCDGGPPLTYACAFANQDAGQLGCAGACYETFANCRQDGFEPEYANNGGAAIDSLWGSGSEFFACGATGVSHTVGAGWSLMPGSPQPPQLWACDVWGTSPSDVYVSIHVGTAGTDIYRYDGTAWAKFATLTQNILALWGFASNDIYGVGDAGAIVHYDGVMWQTLTTPILTTIQDVWGASGNDLFVVGNNGLRYHFNGTMWVDQTLTNSFFQFDTVYGLGPSEVYAGSSDGLYLYNGTSWSKVFPGFTVPAIRAIGSFAGAPLAVGESSGVGFAMQRVGSSWLSVAPPGVPPLYAVAGGSDRLYTGGASSTLLRSWGTTWQSFPQPFQMNIRTGIWANSATDLYIVGGDDVVVGGVLRHSNNGALTSAIGAGTPNLRAVWGNDASTVVAVGDSGQAWHGSGTTFASKNTPTSEALNSVWGTGTLFYAVGTGGKILRFNGTNWQNDNSVTAQPLAHVWGIGTEVFAVGANGTIVRRSGSTWSTMSSGTTAALNGVWGRSATDIYAVGDAGTILHYNGTAWSPMPSGVAATLFNVWGSSGELFVTGSGGTLQLVGGRWLPRALRTPASSALYMSGTSELTAFFGASGVDLLTGRSFRPAAMEAECRDLWDDDEDGLTDCADSDCATSTACIAPGGCRAIVDVACGGMVTSTTNAGGTRYPYYGTGCGPKPEPGPEVYLRVRRPTIGTINVALSGFTGDLDLIASATSPQGACIADEQCIGAAQTAASTEMLSVSAAAATDYLVIVDGASPSAFTVQVTCP